MAIPGFRKLPLAVGLKCAGLAICLGYLIWFVRPGLFAPPLFYSQHIVERDLRALWFAAASYFVDYGRYPEARNAEIFPGGLTAPVAYLASAPRDPYSPGRPEDLRTLDPDGQGAVRVAMAWIGAGWLAYFLAALVRARMKTLFLNEWIGGPAIGAAAVAVWAAAAALLPPEELRLGALFGLCAASLALFAAGRLTFGALLAIAVSAAAAVQSYRSSSVFWLSGAWIAFLAALVRAALFAWTLAAESALESGEPRIPRGAGLRRFAVAVWLSCHASFIVFAQAQFREAGRLSAMARGARPYRCVSTESLFAASSNGIDFQPDWHAGELFRALESGGEQAAIEYLTLSAYDPSNGVRSSGDMTAVARRRHSEAPGLP